MPSFPPLTPILKHIRPLAGWDAVRACPVLTRVPHRAQRPLEAKESPWSHTRTHMHTHSHTHTSFHPTHSLIHIWDFLKACGHVTRCTGFIDATLTSYLDEIFLKKKKR